MAAHFCPASPCPICNSLTISYQTMAMSQLNQLSIVIQALEKLLERIVKIEDAINQFEGDNR